MVSNIKNSPHYVFCAPQPGKPDPKYDPTLGKPRGRVIQKPQKGNTCLYYALQILLNEKKIGKNPSSSQLETREQEKKFSMHRKELTRVENNLKFRFDFAEQFVFGVYKSRSKADVQIFLEFLNTYPNTILEGQRERCKNALEEFCNQKEYDDFILFAKDTYYKAIMDVHQIILGKTLQPFMDQYKKRFNRDWKDATERQQDLFLKNTIFALNYQLYGAKKSSWHPSQPFEKFVAELKQHGCHFVVGRYGHSYYKKEPFKWGELEGRSVFGWKPDAERKDDNSGISHTIVIVGATYINGKELIFFVDPKDGSDPKDIKTQKIYVMSYNRLKETIADLFCLEYKDENDKVTFKEPSEGENNYALHM